MWRLTDVSEAQGIKFYEMTLDDVDVIITDADSVFDFVLELQSQYYEEALSELWEVLSVTESFGLQDLIHKVSMKVTNQEGIRFIGNFEFYAKDASISLGEIMGASIQDSKIYMDEITLTMVFSFEEEKVYGTSNSLYRGTAKYLVISHESLRNCMFTSFWQGLKFARLWKAGNVKESLELLKKRGGELVNGSKKFKKRVKNNLQPNEKLTHTLKDMPLIFNYVKRKTLNSDESLEVQIVNNQFTKIQEWTSLALNEKKKKNHYVVVLRLEGVNTRQGVGHMQLLINKSLFKNTLDSGLAIIQEMDEHFKIERIYETFSDGSQVLKMNNGHFIWREQVYDKFEEIEIAALRESIIPNSQHACMKIEKPKISKYDSKKDNSTENDSDNPYKENITKKIFAFDIETFPHPETGEECAFAIGLVWKQDQETFYRQWWGEDCIIQFFDYLFEFLDTFAGGILYAHNAGRFDNLILLREYLLKQESKFLLTNKKFTVVNNSILHFEMRSKEDLSRKIDFKDSFRMMPAGLKDLTKDFKVKHQKLDYDIGLNRNNWMEHKEDILKYLKHDCLGLLEVLECFRENLFQMSEIDMVNSLTAPSVALKIFLQQYYNDKETPLYELPVMMDRLLRHTYYGGRVECNWLGYTDSSEGHIIMEDFNSLYPHVMTMELPYGAPTFLTQQEMIDQGLLDLENGKFASEAYGFVWVACKSRIEEFGNIPRLHAYHDGMRLLFPDFDELTDLIIFSEELKLSMELNLPYNYTFKGMIQFKHDNYLDKFIVEFYKTKQVAALNDEEAKKMISKLYMNSLYGTFGIKKERSSFSIFNREETESFYCIWNTGKVSNVFQIGDYTCVVHQELIKPKACAVYVANAITALARMLQYRFQYDLIKDGHKVIFGDTDSTCFQLKPGYSLQDYRNSKIYQDYVLGGTDEVLGKMKDEMQGYMKKLSNEKKLEYLESMEPGNQLTVHDGIFPAKRVFTAGCKMYFLETDFENVNYTKIALKGYKGKKDMNLGKFKNLFSQQGLDNNQTQFKICINDETNPFHIKIGEVQKKFYSGYFKGNIETVGESLLYDEEELEQERFDEFVRLLQLEEEYSNVLNNHNKRSRIIQEDMPANKKLSKHYAYKVIPFKVSEIVNTKRPFPKETFEFYLKNKI